MKESRKPLPQQAIFIRENQDLLVRLAHHVYFHRICRWVQAVCRAHGTRSRRHCPFSSPISHMFRPWPLCLFLHRPVAKACSSSAGSVILGTLVMCCFVQLPEIRARASDRGASYLTSCSNNVLAARLVLRGPSNCICSCWCTSSGRHHD